MLRHESRPFCPVKVSALTYTMLHNLLITFPPLWNCYLPTQHFFLTLERIKASSLDVTALRRTHLCYDICHIFLTVYQHIFLAYMTQMSQKPNDTSLVAHYLSGGFSQYCKVCIPRFWERDFTDQQICHLDPHSCLFCHFSSPCWRFWNWRIFRQLVSVGLGTGHTYGPHPWSMTELSYVTASGTFILTLSVHCNTQRQRNILTSGITRRCLARWHTWSHSFQLSIGVTGSGWKERKS